MACRTWQSATSSSKRARQISALLFESRDLAVRLSWRASLSKTWFSFLQTGGLTTTETINWNRGDLAKRLLQNGRDLWLVIPWKKKQVSGCIFPPISHLNVWPRCEKVTDQTQGRALSTPAVMLLMVALTSCPFPPYPQNYRQVALCYHLKQLLSFSCTPICMHHSLDPHKRIWLQDSLSPIDGHLPMVILWNLFLDPEHAAWLFIDWHLFGQMSVRHKHGK